SAPMLHHCLPSTYQSWHAALSDAGLTLAGVDFEEKSARSQSANKHHVFEANVCKKSPYERTGPRVESEAGSFFHNLRLSPRKRLMGDLQKIFQAPPFATRRKCFETSTEWPRRRERLPHIGRHRPGHHLLSGKDRERRALERSLGTSMAVLLPSV